MLASAVLCSYRRGAEARLARLPDEEEITLPLLCFTKAIACHNCGGRREPSEPLRHYRSTSGLNALILH